MGAFKDALDILFSDPNLARDVIHTPKDGSAPVQVRAIIRRPDEITGFGEARIWSETTRLDLRASEGIAPCPGDLIAIGNEPFVVQGEPVRDPERLVWTVELRPA